MITKDEPETNARLLAVPCLTDGLVVYQSHQSVLCVLWHVACEIFCSSSIVNYYVLTHCRYWAFSISNFHYDFTDYMVAWVVSIKKCIYGPEGMALFVNFACPSMYNGYIRPCFRSLSLMALWNVGQVVMFFVI